MTKTEELIDEVLKLDAEATSDWKTIAHCRSSAPILAKMLKRAIEQRDSYMCELLLESNSSQFPSDVKAKDDAELDRIFAEGLGEK